MPASLAQAPDMSTLNPSIRRADRGVRLVRASGSVGSGAAAMSPLAAP
jgi:hypothetical protein